MRKKDPKTRCVKRKIVKCSEVLRTYDPVQYAFADLLDQDPEITLIQVNVPLEDTSIGEFTTDFVFTKEDGSIGARECVLRKNLFRPRTIKLLDFSQQYWLQRGVTDWKVVIDSERE